MCPVWSPLTGSWRLGLRLEAARASTPSLEACDRQSSQQRVIFFSFLLGLMLPARRHPVVTAACNRDLHKK